MRMILVLLAVGLAMPVAERAYAKKYNEFQLKELHQARAERKEEKEEMQREEQEDQETAHLHAKAHTSSSTRDRLGPDETEHLRDDE